MAAPFNDQLFRAIADYAVKWPAIGNSATMPSTGSPNTPRVRETAFASVLLTGNSQEGGGTASGQRGFPQEVLIDALHCRRYDLDNTYALPLHLAAYSRRSHPPWQEDRCGSFLLRP